MYVFYLFALQSVMSLNSEINLSFLIKPFFYITKKSGRYKKHFSSFLKRLSLKQENNFFGGSELDFK